MRRSQALTVISFLALLSACDGTFVVDPNDPRLDLTVAREQVGDPLIFLNGSRISMTEMQELDRDRIESIEVIKGRMALAFYGDSARDGVIQIRLKQ